MCEIHIQNVFPDSEIPPGNPQTETHFVNIFFYIDMTGNQNLDEKAYIFRDYKDGNIRTSRFSSFQCDACRAKYSIQMLVCSYYVHLCSPNIYYDYHRKFILVEENNIINTLTNNLQP